MKVLITKLRPMVSKKYGKDGGSKLKIEGFLLLQKIQELLKELKIAVYPFLVEPEHQIKQNQQFQKYK